MNARIEAAQVAFEQWLQFRLFRLGQLLMRLGWLLINKSVNAAELHTMVAKTGHFSQTLAARKAIPVMIRREIGKAHLYQVMHLDPLKWQDLEGLKPSNPEEDTAANG